LAAGLGSRFGGLKQLAVVRADGAAIMDVLVRRSAAAGFERAVIVIAPRMEERVRAHLDTMSNAPIPVELAVQALKPGRDRPSGTADAVLAARESIDGSFAVVNGDDLYPATAFASLADQLHNSPDEHAMVAFRVARTLTGNRRVSRALVDVDGSSAILSIREGTVVPAGDGLRFEAGTSVQSLRDDAYVSMNMWGFRPSIFDALADAVAEFIRDGRDDEAYLPDVLAALVASGITVRALVSEERCIGVTHDDDLAAVWTALS
jgi:NDP-sugar pyrophosphorylase family protein